MPISNSYPKGIPIEEEDLFVGTKAYSNRTVNYTAQGVADYLNINSKVAIGGQMSFQFTIVPNIPKTIAFEGGGGDNTAFSAITKLIVSAIDVSTANITIFLNYLNNSQVLLSQQNQPNFFGHYKMTGYTQIGTSAFYELELEFIGGNGNIGDKQYYDLVSFVLSSEVPPPVWGNITGDIEDQTDLINYISSQIVTPTLQNVLTAGREFDETTGINSIEIKEGTFNIPSDSYEIKETIQSIDGEAISRMLSVKRKEIALQDVFLNDVDGNYEQTQIRVETSGASPQVGIFYNEKYKSSTDKTSGLSITSETLDPDLETNTNYLFKQKLVSGTYNVATTDDIPTTGYLPKTTASGTDTYTATVTGVTAYTDGDAYLIRFTNGNTTGATLNINTLGAKSLYRNNDGALIGGDIWDGAEMLCVFNSTLNGFQCIGTSPNALFSYVTNADSVSITKGMPVYAFGGQGDRMTVKRANNTSDATSAQTVGLVASTSIAAGQKGIIIMQGLLDGLNILPTSTYSDGDAIYLGATAGSITKVKPYAPNHLVYLGVVTTASNGNAGRMYVRVQNGYELQELHNVDALNPNNNDGIFYNSSTQLWEHKNVLAVAAERRNANNSTNNNINYCGIAPADSLENASVWTITRLTITLAGAVTTASATNVAWTNRESVIYT
jgi:hypothetical protein